MNEPTTVVTDYLLAALAFVLALRLWRSGFPPPRSRRLWAASFVVVAGAALTGGTWHGIPPDALPLLRHHLWSITYVLIGFADLLILLGATWAALPRRSRAVALGLLTGRFFAYAVVILGQRDFRYVGYDYLGTLVLLFAFGLYLGRRRAPAAGFVLGGASVCFIGALVQSLRVGPCLGLNHNDLFHVIQMAGVWLFYRGGLLFGDSAGPCLPDAGHCAPELRLPLPPAHPQHRRHALHHLVGRELGGVEHYRVRGPHQWRHHC